MRAAMMVAAVVGILALPTAGSAAPIAVPDGVAVATPNIEQVWGGCGRGWHPVRGYRDRWGRWSPRRCAPNW